VNSKRKFYDSITLSLIISNDLSDDTTTSSSLSTYRFKYKRHCLKNVYLVLGGQSLYFLVLALSGSCFKGGDDNARRRPYRYLPTYLHVFIIVNRGYYPQQDACMLFSFSAHFHPPVKLQITVLFKYVEDKC